jgi:hypothetical protein
MRPKLGRRSFFTPEGKVAPMFLKMYTGLSCPKLLEQLNGHIHYQIFCDVIIDPTRPLTNYKLLDGIMLDLAGKLKIQQLQGILADKWRPYMENLDTMYTDAKNRMLSNLLRRYKNEEFPMLAGGHYML